MLSNNQIYNAVGDLCVKIFKYSMPKRWCIIMVLFEPLINLINSGDNIIIQQGSGLIIFKLIEYISKEKNNIFNDIKDANKLFEIITKKYLNNFLKGIQFYMNE